MKHLKSISGSSQAAAKLTLLLFFWASSLFSADVPPPFAPVAGVWPTHFSNGIDRVYHIGEDGSVRYEQKDPPESKSSKLNIIKGEFLAEFDERLMLFYKASDDVLKVEIFNPKSRFEKRESSVVGTGHRVGGVIPAAAPVAKVLAPSLQQLPVQSKPSAPVPVAAPSAPDQSGKNINLKTGWDGPMQGGSKTMEDLAFVLNGYAKADPNPPFEEVEIYNGVKYLMPLNEAVTALGIKGRLPAMKKVVCPGFPRESLNYTSVDGLFEGHYNRMDLVTDMANQVVTMQFVDEHPKDTTYVSFLLKGNWLTYNFVGYRVKAMTTLSVDYSLEAYDSKQSRWWREKPEYLAKYYPTSPTLRVTTYLMDKHQVGKPDKRLEETLWCVPRPLASLILHCVGKGQR